MKRFDIHTIALVLLLAAVAIVGLGCGEQLGETASEGHRRHKRNLRINNSEFWSDVDRALLFDKPSRLTDKRIP